MNNTISYEISGLNQGWYETSDHQENDALASIQSLTGWTAEQCEEAHNDAAAALAGAEHDFAQEKAQDFYDQHGFYPTKTFKPRCSVEYKGYSVTRHQIKTHHSSERCRFKYTWSEN